MNDTDPQVAQLVRKRLLERSGVERVMMACGMFEAAKAMVMASFPAGLSELEIKERLVTRFYRDEVDVRAFVEHLKSLQEAADASQ